MANSRLRERTTSDLLVLMIAGTICVSILVFGGVVVLDTLIHPETNHNVAIGLIANTIQMLVSLLAGFIAGRTDTIKRTQSGNSEEDT